MAAKAKAVWTHNALIKEIKKLIRHGQNVDAIINIMQSQVPEDVMNHSTLADLCEEVVNDYPDYELIQKIQRSKLVINVNEKPDKFYIVDPTTDIVTTINATNAKALFLRPDFSDKTFMSEFTYNPYALNKLYKDENNFWAFNTYNCPFWLIDHFYYDKPVLNSELPSVYKKFLTHLTNGDEDSFTYLLDWLTTLLRGRNYCILSTIGNQGVGKGVLGNIMEKLVGLQNFSLTDNRLITKEFNAQILNKRLVYIDELKVTNSKEENRLKLLINDTVEVEAKGVDSKNSINYASIYVSSNDFDAVRLRGDDRRFSIIELTEVKLVEVFDKHEIESLFADANIEKFARFLWHREVENKMNQVFVTERTAQIRESALKGWEEWFMEEYLPANEGEVLLNDVTEEIENIFGSRVRPSRKALGKLNELYPDSFKVVRKKVKKDGKDYRQWYIKIL